VSELLAARRARHALVTERITNGGTTWGMPGDSLGWKEKHHAAGRRERERAAIVGGGPIQLRSAAVIDTDELSQLTETGVALCAGLTFGARRRMQHHAPQASILVPPRTTTPH
jgi:hypothetical protein